MANQLSVMSLGGFCSARSYSPIFLSKQLHEVCKVYVVYKELRRSSVLSIDTWTSNSFR